MNGNVLIHGATMVLPNETGVGDLRIRNGVIESIALGANVGAMARPFLEAAQEGVEGVVQLIEALKEEIRVIQFVTGAGTTAELQSKAVLRDKRTGEKVA